MLLALALYASTAHAGVPAGFGGTPGIVNENTPHYHIELLYHDGKAHRPDKRLLLRLSPSPRHGAHSPGTSTANLKTGVGAPSEGAHGPPREFPLGPRVILRRRGARVKRRDAHREELGRSPGGASEASGTVSNTARSTHGRGRRGRRHIPGCRRHGTSRGQITAIPRKYKIRRELYDRVFVGKAIERYVVSYQIYRRAAAWLKAKEV